MNYPEILDYLARNWRKTVLTEPIAHFDFAAEARLLAALGDPHQGMRYLHVTGSKGKGSTAYLAARLLQMHGVRVGLFTSPHLSRVEERISVDGQVIPPEEFAAELSAALAAREQVAPYLGIFPALIAAALTWFRRQSVDVAVVEVRSGGRYDPTNIIPARHQIITAIEAEHIPGLGRTVAEIAGQKSGIIKPDSTVTVDEQEPSVAAVIAEEAARQGARLREAGRDLEACPIYVTPSGTRYRYRTPGGRTGRGHLALLGRHQVTNAGLAIAAVEAILAESGRPLDAKAVERALATARWPARLDVLSERPRIVYDAAHTPNSARQLAESLRAHFGPGRWQIIVALLRSKDAGAIPRELAPVTERILAVPLPGFAAHPPDQIVAAARAAGLSAEAWPSLSEALAEARALDEPIAITGTLYLYDSVKAAIEAHEWGKIES